MLTSEFDFSFPKNQVAYRPAKRGESRLMVISKNGKLPDDFSLQIEKEGWAFGRVSDLIGILKSGDVLAINETKVIKARLYGHLDDGTPCNVSVIKPQKLYDEKWECLVHPAGKATSGVRINFSAGLIAHVVEKIPGGDRLLCFNIIGEPFMDKLEEIGEMPIPPYMGRRPDKEDEENYQSIFARNPGSVAAPTASLHFSKNMVSEVVKKGACVAPLTLHIGSGTFRSVLARNIEDHEMHSEEFNLSKESAEIMNLSKLNAHRLFAIGTTSARTIESCANHAGILDPKSGLTSLFIAPGYKWKAVDCLLTNFHFPRSTLFMLICSLLGTNNAKKAYSEAFARGFRLFSYGDAMLIL